jgi:hypothetical protein
MGGTEPEGSPGETGSTPYGDLDLQLAGRIDQIIGWAKVGRNSRYYTMTAENVDSMRDDIIRALHSLGDHGAEHDQVTVSREGLRTVLDYARQFDVDDDPAMIRLSAAAEADQ